MTTSRRELIIALGVLALNRSLSAFAQQSLRVWRIGFLSARSRDASAESDFIEPFVQGMRNLGYIEGKNVVYEWRFANGKYDRLRGLAEELVKLKVDVIVASATPASRAAQQATRTIPIVIASVADPVGSGLVASLVRPGGNITGVANFVGDTTKKQLDVLTEMVPRLSRVAALLNPDSPASELLYKNIQASAQSIGVSVFPVQARTPEDIELAFSTMRKERVRAFISVADPFFTQQRAQIARLALKARLPAVFPRREFAEAGGLMSYGTNTVEVNRHAASHVDKILKGAKPADLPVEQPTQLELVVNVNTAKALGIKIPNSLLVRADRVIE